MAKRKTTKKKKLTPNRKTWVVSQLRRLSMKWPPRNRVLKNSRRELPRKIKKDGTPYKKPNYEYQCNICKNWFKSSKVQIDHIIPIMNGRNIDLTEPSFYAHFVPELLCYEDNLQVLCIKCHDKKTASEK